MGRVDAERCGVPLAVAELLDAVIVAVMVVASVGIGFVNELR